MVYRNKAVCAVDAVCSVFPKSSPQIERRPTIRLNTRLTIRSRVLRALAAVTSVSMGWWSAGPALAATVTNQRALRLSHGHTRILSPVEMAHIVGAQYGGGGNQLAHTLSAAPDSGPTYPWEGNAPPSGGPATPPEQVNTGNGNKFTSLPLVGWKCRGGRLAISLSLFHNSEGSHNSELGYKWTHSYDIYSMIDATTGDFTAHFGDDLSYTFTANISGGFDAPTGIHDTLTATGTGTSTVYTLTKPDQTLYTFSYLSGPAAWYCTSISDRNGNSITLSHNSGGFVTSVTDPTSRSISFTYTSGKITGISDPLSRSWVLSYTSGELTSVAFPTVGNSPGTTYSVSYGYNSGHDITSYTDLRGKVWTYSYYSDDSLDTATDPLSHSTSYVYRLGSTTITDANGHDVVHSYNSSGLLTGTTDAASHSDSYSYDSDNNRTGVTEKRGHSWSFTYDSMGNMLTRTDPLSHVTTWTYNSKNATLTMTTELGNETDYAYDTNGNLTSVTDPLSHATTYAYDSYGYGEVISITDALSHETDITYDTDGNVTGVTDPLSHSTTIGYDGIGRATSETDATSKTTSTSYDALGRVVSVTNPGSRTTTFAYSDGSGLKSSVTDPLSHVNSYSYDDAGRLTSRTDSNSHTVYFGYDSVGNKTSFTDGNGHVTTIVTPRATNFPASPIPTARARSTATCTRENFTPRPMVGA